MDVFFPEAKRRPLGFISEDQARDGSNWYIYCYSNPLAFVDPSGLDPVTSPNYKKDPSGGLDRLRALAIIKKAGQRMNLCNDI